MTDTFELVGSGWTASATVVEEFGPGDGRALRLLRVVEAVRPAADRAALVVSRLTIDSAAVDLAGVTASWSAGDTPLTVDLVLAVHEHGAGSTLRATPLAGDIALGWLVADDVDEVEALHRFIGVIPSPHQEPVLSPDGVVIRGSRSMPWDDDSELSAAYTAHPLKEHPTGVGSEPDRIRVTPELARLDASDRAAWTSSWRNFATVLAADDGPEWMRLTVPNPREVPAVAFLVDRVGGTRHETMMLPTGSLVVELTDGVPRHPERPVRSALRLHGTAIAITRDRIDIAHVSTSVAAPTDADLQMTVTATRANGTWMESVAVNGRFEPDPVALAEQLRASTIRDGSKPGVLTASTVLADGWLQLPVPDVVDQDYVDSSIKTPERPRSGRAEGAVVWGNEVPELQAAALTFERSEEGLAARARSEARDDDEEDENPDLVAARALSGRTRWSVALLDAGAFRGTWTLAPAGDDADDVAEAQTDGTGQPRRVVGGTLELFGVSATADGLWWLAAGADPAEDAPPPRLDGWSRAVAPVPLHAGGAVAGRRPSALTIDLNAEFGPRPLAKGNRLVGELTRSSVAFGVDRGVTSKLYGSDDTGKTRSVSDSADDVDPGSVSSAANDDTKPPFDPTGATAWVRHPALPTVQSLPLDTTVSRRQPSASRELMPWELQSGTWVLVGEERSWPRLDSAPLIPARDWVAFTNLTQAVLSMPGVELAPDADGLRARVRHDLPFLDEAAAFATVDEGVVESSTAEPWWRLDERGVLAAVEQARLLAFEGPLEDHAAEATVAVFDGRRGRSADRHVATDMSAYPGSLTVGGQVLFDPDPGVGDRLAGRTDVGIGMQSGAIPLVVEGPNGRRRTRDQDDIGRGDATISGGWLRVPVYDGDTESYVAASSLTPLELTGAGTTWTLAVDGLPMRPRTGGEDGLRFDHGDRSGLLADDAHRTHHWRLGPEPLWLGGLEVYPVRLESLTIDGAGDLVEVEIDVRLQVRDGAVRVPRPRLPGLVRLRYAPALDEVRLLDDRGIWSLNNLDGTPLIDLRWDTISYHEGVVTVGGVTAHFHLFDQPWTVPLDQPLQFGAHFGDGIVGSNTTGGGTGALRWTGFDVTLDLFGELRDMTERLTGHTATLDLELTAGTGTGVYREIFAPVTIKLGSEVLSAEVVPDKPVRFFGRRLEPNDVSVALGSRSLQLSWPDATADDDGLEVLPGMKLSPADRPGVVSARFVPRPAAGEPAPELDVTALHAEQVLGCSWRAGPRWGDMFSLEATDSSYRGDLSVGYVGTLTDDGWKASFVLDGVVEIAGLVSHAGHDDLDDPGRVTPYSPTERDSVIRHAARILFQQHRLDDLTVQDEGNTLVGLSGPIGLDVVVEHCLRRFTPGEGDYRIDAENRFAVPQRVLLLRPRDLAERLVRQRELGRPIGGFADPAFTGLIDRALDELPGDSLLIEASVSALVRRVDHPATNVSRLRTVPAGVIEVVRAGLDDHLDETPWAATIEGVDGSTGLVQLDLPFLAVTLASAAERPAADSAAAALVTDPVDVLAAVAGSDPANGDAPALARLLTSRAEQPEGASAPAAVDIGAFDGDARTFAHAAERRIVTAWQVLVDPTTPTADLLATWPLHDAAALARLLTSKAESPEGISAPAAVDRSGSEPDGEPGGIDGILVSEADVLGRMGSPATLRRVLSSAVVAEELRRLPHHVSFDHSGRTWPAPVVAFDFTVNDEPQGTDGGKLERSGTGWHLDSGAVAGLHFTDLSDTKESKSKATVVGAAAPLVAAIKEAGAFSIHLRVRPDKSPQRGPARMLSLSSSNIKRLFTVAQEGDQIVVRVRNGSNDTNGDNEEVRSDWKEGPLLVDRKADPPVQRWVEIAYVFDGAGERLYINGNAVGIMVHKKIAGRSGNQVEKKWYTRARARTVDFDSWDPAGMELLLGNEHTGKRPWFGHWSHVAVFAGAVTPADLAGTSPTVAGSRTPLPFLATGPSVRRAFPVSAENPVYGIRHHVATNILPVDFDGGGDLVPSPYVTFGMTAAPAEGTEAETDGAKDDVLATTAELLLDGTATSLVSAGGRFWEGEAGDAEIRRWAEHERARVGGDSARTVVRLRQVVAAPSDTNDASVPGEAVSAKVGFLVLAPNPAPPRLGWRSSALRTGSARHRRPDRHLLDSPWPAQVSAPDIAPPLVRALDVVRDDTAGISGLSIDTSLTATGGVSTNGEGRAEPVWLGVSRQVRFAADVDSLGQPDDFDAPTRAVLAPTAAAPPLPSGADVDSLGQPDDDDGPTRDDPSPTAVGAGQQAVAVDRVRHVLTGIRPGALVEVRSHRQRRNGEHTFAAGTVPTVIRAPRPLVSGPSIDPRTATRPSAGLIDRAATVLADGDRFELVSIRDEACLKIEVSYPGHGTISRDHQGDVIVDVKPVGVSLESAAADDTWTVTAGFVGGSGPYSLDPGSSSIRIEIKDDDDVGRLLLRSTPIGDDVVLRMQVTHSRNGRTEDRQVDLPLRVVADEDLPLLLEPRFCRFEDPEYNRAISTAVVGTEVPIEVKLPIDDADADEGYTFVLSKDRPAHAPGAPLIVGVQVRAPEGVVLPETTAVKSNVGDGLQVVLQIPGRSAVKLRDPDETVVWAVSEPGRVGWVATVELPSDLDPDNPPTLVARVPGIGVEASMTVALVEHQAPPSPTAAYALLREETEGAVSCPLYALGPNASRISLVDTHDVLSTIMRYRAEFTWTDVVRAGTNPRYEVQKISRLGATHIPPFR